MSRIRLAVIVFAGLLVGLASLQLLTRPALMLGEPIQARPPNYSDPTAWVLQPDALPPAVWDAGWSVDYFVLTPPAHRLARHGQTNMLNPAVAETVRNQIAPLTFALSEQGPVYMPALRHVSVTSACRSTDLANDDLFRALEHYVEHQNRGRALAFVVAPGAEPLLPALASWLAQDEASDIRARTVLVLAPQDASDAVAAHLNVQLPEAVRESYATRRVTDPGLWLTGIAWRLKGVPDSDTAGLTTRLGLASADQTARLEANVSKTVEPFGLVQRVERQPILRPPEN